MAAKQTAAECYAERLNDVSILTDCIQMELEVHAEEAKADPKNWGHAGSLGYVREQLKNVLMFLMGSRFESEAEASRFIEEHLETMREDQMRKEG